MPVKYITEKIKYPNWTTERYRRLDILERFLEGTIYDHLEYPFYQEVRGQDTYIPLRDRRPSVKYNLPYVVVTRSTSMLFGGNHWPKIHTASKELTDFIQDHVERSNLQNAMIEAAHIGSLGSVAIIFKIINKQYFYEVWNTKYCTPVFDGMRELETLWIMQPTKGYELIALGFGIKEEDQDEWFFYTKKYDAVTETIYHPIKCDEYEKKSDLKIKEEIKHNLGMFPGVWIKNFPKTSGIDSACTYQYVTHICVEIDYQLSQCGRGLKYNADPQLLIKEPPGEPNAGQLGLFDGTQPRVRSTSNALFVGNEGDAKLLEIDGAGQKAVLEFVKLIRQYALEVARSSKKDPDRAYGNMSGRAMEILDEELIGLASVLRLSYGESGLKPLLAKMVMAANKLGFSDKTIDPQNREDSIKFIWGNWFDPTPADLLHSEQALDTAVKGRRLFMSEARMLSSSLWGIGHTEVEKLDKEWAIPEIPELEEPEPMIPKAGAASSNGDSRRQ